MLRLGGSAVALPRPPAPRLSPLRAHALTAPAAPTPAREAAHGWGETRPPCAWRLARMCSPRSATRATAGGDGQTVETLSLRVAVIGAGASGLAAARELLAEGHQIKVFEASHQIGGIWAYDPHVDSDPLGTAKDRRKVHSSMYASLRTNLPREIMSYMDLPFTPEFMGGRSIDPRRFCSHEEVMLYLEAYAEHYDLSRHIRLGRTVTSAVPIQEPTADIGTQSISWDVVHEGSAGEEQQETERFNALVVANGHFSQPNVPEPPLPGTDSWPGKQLHSHNYRTPGGFAGQKVVVVGAQSSGEDISREVASVAKEVYLCARTWKDPSCATNSTPYGERSNMWRRNNLAALRSDGSVEFEGGIEVQGVDTVIYCTGYRYSLPFLEDSGLIDTSCSRVEPLYGQVFVPQVAPRLSFIGLPFNVVAFHLFQMQSKWVAQALSGKTQLSPTIVEETETFYRELEDEGLSGRYAHEMRDKQWSYLDWVADSCQDVQRLPSWRKDMHIANGQNKRANPTTYRDEQYDPEFQQAAAEEFEGMREFQKAEREAQVVNVL